ncbi:MAG TPA: 6-bladed beta-propeller [Coriobacteriia bacterium]|nr:6-bladed beta-propeller [Coriobacteriia bacterium]
MALFLVLFVAFLTLYPRDEALVVRGGEEVGGIVPVLTISGPGRGERPEFARPMGGTVDDAGRIYVADTGNNRVVVFDSDGRYLFEFGGFGIAKPLPGYESTWEEGLMNYPLGIDVDADGTIYVADFRNDQVQVFDSEGTFVRRFPDPATVVGRGASGQDGFGIAVTDVAVDGDLVYAADTYQVVVFTAEGEFVRQFGRPGTGPGEFNHITGIDVLGSGRIIVADSNNHRVQVLSALGEHLWSIGKVPGTSDDEARAAGAREPYEFGLPRSVAVTEDGTIAVLDTFNFSIALFTPDGRLKGTYGERGTTPGQMNFANSIEAAGERLLVSDKENGRVQLLEVVR